MSEVERLTAAEDVLGEGLLWDAAQNRVLWVDIQRRLVRAWHADGSVARWSVPERPTAVLGCTGDELLLATERGLGRLDTASGTLRLDLRIPVDDGLRVNDAARAPDGRIFAGTLDERGRPKRAALYRVDPDRTVHRVVSGVTMSNGLAWSPDGTSMYYIDTLAHGVDAFDYDPASGALRNRRRIVSIAPETGLPDGMTVDADGLLWVALWGGGAVHRYAPDGELAAVVPIPAPHVTNCCFGGAELDRLYVSTARQDMRAAELERRPESGSLFRVDVGARGVATVPAAPA